MHARALVFLGCNDAARSDDNIRQCHELASRPDYVRITIAPLFKVTRRPVSQRDVVAPDACASSICYRAPAPYLIGVKVGDITDESRLIMMPNKSPIMSMNLPGGVFASAKARVDLVHGIPAVVGISQDSELLQVVAIPLDIIKGFFQGVGEVFSLRVQYDNSSVSLLKAEEARQKAEEAYHSGLTARTAAKLSKAQADLTKAVNGTYQTEKERYAAIDEAQKEASAAATEHNIALAELGATLASFDGTAVDRNGDEAGTIMDFIQQPLCAAVSGDTDAAAAQKAQITLLDETQRMFSITVLDNAAGSAVRTKVNASASPSGSAQLVPPDVSDAPKVDPDAANDKTDEN